MKKIIYLFALCVLIASCGKDAKVKQEEVVGNAAKQYYTYLLKGDYEAFVDGTYHKDSLRAFFHLQLVENAKMFMAQQKKERQGIKSFEVQEVDVDTAQHTANVFMMVKYGDSSKERVLLPMVEHDGLWYMR